ncbi:hypothetical protein D0Z08_28370 [Nocardioides immobilis]|uniref:Uncharacterized protein n=1 Tax=Nocardioides immobilis TaxID=2049295 RepID=A0A417XTR8_9ACTN|nr:hypothetical protein D0Z08_28370 [Nocardioides immobilis]
MSREPKTERVGIYWRRDLWDLARSAYVADLDDDPSAPGAFLRWLHRAIERHAARTPAERAAFAETTASGTRSGGGLRTSHPLSTTTIGLIQDAIVGERRHSGRVISRSAFVQEAAVAAAALTRQRRGRRALPPPPARLTNRPPRR